MTPTEESMFRGSARTALTTGIPMSIRYGADALHDLDIVLDETLSAGRVLVGGLDRRDAVSAGAALEVAHRGAFVGLDHVGRNDRDDYLDDQERAALVIELVTAGFRERVLLSSNAIGVAKGQPDDDLPFSHVLSTFVPILKSQGLRDEDIQRILVANPRDLLSVH